MKIKELNNLTEQELIDKEKIFKKKIFELNVQRKTGRVEKPSEYRFLKKDIARILTILNERAKDGNKSE